MRLAMCLFIYLFFGTIALIVICICCATITAIQLSADLQSILTTFLSMDEPHLISTLQKVFLDKLPFGNIIENAAGAGGLGIDMILGTLRGESFSFFELLFDIVTATLAGTIIHLFNRANRWLSLIFSGFDFEIALSIVLMIWSICGYTIAILIMQIIDTFVLVTTANTIVKIILFIICILLHAFFLADRTGNQRFIKTPILFLLKRLGRDFICSLAVAYLCSRLHGLYDYSYFWSFMLAALIATVIFAAEIHHAKADEKRLGI